MRIATEIITVSNYIGSAAGQFDIPPYQRKYEWDKQNVEDLLDDLKEHLSNHPDVCRFERLADEAEFADADKYLLGSVFLYESNPGGNRSVAVIDGQQRSITISLLAMVLAKKFEQLRERVAEEFGNDRLDAIWRIFKQPLDRLYKIPGNILIGAPDRPKINVGHGREVYARMIGAPTVEGVVAERGDLVGGRYVDNAKIISNFVDENIAQIDADREKFLKICIFSGLLLRLTSLIVIRAIADEGVPANDVEVINLFSKINARGKDLAQSDLLKVHFLSGANQARNQELAEQWDSIFEDKTTQETDSYFNLIYAAIKKDFPKTVSDAWTEMMRGLDGGDDRRYQFWSRNIYPVLSVSNFNYYTGVAAGFSDPVKLKGFFSALQQFRFTEWEAVLYHERIQNGAVNHDRIINLIQRLLNVSFCFACLGYTDKTRRRVIKEIFWSDNTEVGVGKYIELCKSAVVRLQSEDVYLLSSLRRKTVLLFIDRILSRNLGIWHEANVHIEHVLPQNHAEWISHDGWMDVGVIENWKHKLGNLALLPQAVNAAVSNSRFDDKCRRIQELGVNVNAYGLRINCNNENGEDALWTPDRVERRHKFILDKVGEFLYGDGNLVG